MSEEKPEHIPFSACFENRCFNSKPPPVCSIALQQITCLVFKGTVHLNRKLLLHLLTLMCSKPV